MIATVAVIVFVFAVLGLVAYALFELSPFARHAESYRDASGARLESPHLDTRDEFERGAR